MMRTALLIIALLPAFSRAISQVNFGRTTDSILVSTANFAVKRTNQFYLDGDWNVYVTSTFATNYLKQVRITSRPDIGSPKEQGLDEFLQITPNGLLIASPLSNTWISVMDYSRVPGNAVILFIKKSKDVAPIYDASIRSRSITSDSKWAVSAVTLLSAGVYFTLSTFTIGNTADIAVHAMPFHLAASSGFDPIINIGDKDYAKKSFVTIIGPIATVSIKEPSAASNATFFSFNSHTSNWFTGATFSPGSQFSIPSPGLMSIDSAAVLPHFFDAKRMIGDFEAAFSRDSAITYDVRIPSGINGFKFQSISSGGVTSTNNGVTQRNVEAIANEIKLDYNITNGYSRFLIQITSKFWI